MTHTINHEEWYYSYWGSSLPANQKPKMPWRELGRELRFLLGRQDEWRWTRTPGTQTVELFAPSSGRFCGYYQV